MITNIAPKSKKIAVVGAGPAGLAFAKNASDRGHEVHIFDGSHEIGGQFNIAKQIPGKEEFRETIRYFSRRIDRTGVKLKLSTRVEKKDLDAAFDAVVIATGGGPGIMEAADRGAHDAGAPSIGYNITLPMEQEPNAFSTPDLTLRFHYFAMRKMHFAMRANALVVFPGGLGTFDELFEILALRQTGKSPPIPIVLYDQKFWEEVVNFNALVKHGVISKVDETLFTYAETPEQAWKQCVDGGVMTRWLQEQHTT